MVDYFFVRMVWGLLDNLDKASRAPKLQFEQVLLGRVSPLLCRCPHLHATVKPLLLLMFSNASLSLRAFRHSQGSRVCAVWCLSADILPSLADCKYPHCTLGGSF